VKLPRAAAGRLREKYEWSVEELGAELPQLYGARRQFFADSLLGFFGLQRSFHTQTSYIFRSVMLFSLHRLGYKLH
jgi:hypothetical protein